jgi:putative sterol carrier protein
MERVSDVTPSSASGGQPTRPHPSVQRYARLPALIDAPATEIAASLGRLTDLLSAFEEPATVNLHFVGASGTQRWHLALGGQRATTAEGAAEDPALEVIMRPDTWTEIASGSLSPLLAFGSGRMRVRGDIGLAKRLLRHLATSSDAIVEIC